MKNLNKTLLATTLLASLFTAQSVMADEVLKEGAKAGYSSHPHATNESVQRDHAAHIEHMKHMQRENYMMQHSVDDDASLDAELFPDPEQ